jgi:glyoxylase-like metal-dependent hydrolase (beta-lactamase superfamily II)
MDKIMKTIFTLLVIGVLSLNTLYAQDIFKAQIGEYSVYTFSEGQQQGSTRILKNASAEIIKETAPNGVFPNATNCFLIQKNGINMLIDAGLGKKLADNLKSAGIKPESIGAVLLTHAHGDHIGGLLKDGKPVFANAAIYVSKKEHDYWLNAGNKAYIAVTEAYPAIFTMEPNPLNEISKPLNASLKNGQNKKIKPLLSDIFAIECYGHTPGHVAYLLQSQKGEKLLIWGDLTHAMAVQMPYPKVAVTYDTNPNDAVESRLKMLDYAVKNKIPAAGMHIAYPAMGTVAVKNGGFEFLPLK